MHPAVRRQTLADLLHRTAKRFPKKTGLVCGSMSWTYAEFDSVVDRVAAGLSRMGVGHASRVAVLARNSHGFAALRFALARLGAVLVPINFMLNADEVAYILRHAQARSCRWRCCARWRGGCRRSGSGTCMARPRSRRSPPCSALKNSSRGRALAGEP